MIHLFKTIHLMQQMIRNKLIRNIFLFLSSSGYLTPASNHHSTRIIHSIINFIKCADFQTYTYTILILSVYNSSNYIFMNYIYYNCIAVMS